MQAERWKQIEDLYRAALAQPPEERAAFLTAACTDDPQLRGEVHGTYWIATEQVRRRHPTALSLHQCASPSQLATAGLGRRSPAVFTRFPGFRAIGRYTVTSFENKPLPCI